MDAATDELQLLVARKAQEEATLKRLTGCERLQDVTYLETVVDTTVHSANGLGEMMPGLQELKLNNSIIQTLRDLGTALHNLRVLWVSQCGLIDLEGVTGLPKLQELYAAYNDVSDLSPLQGLSSLEVLDLEGNCVSDIDMLYYLRDCDALRNLCLVGNPAADTATYRDQVFQNLPDLQLLDDQPGGALSDASAAACAVASAAEGAHAASSSSPQELQLVRDAIKRARVGMDSQEFAEAEMSTAAAGVGSGCSDGLPSDLRPGSAPFRPASTGGWIKSLRASAGPAAHAQQQEPLRTATNSSGSSRPSSTGSAPSRPASAGTSPRGRPASSSSLQTVAHGGGSSILADNAAGAPQRPVTAATPALGLFWRKHRLDSGTTADAGHEDDSEDEAASELTHGQGGTLGGSLAGSLRRRKQHAPASMQLGHSASVLSRQPAPVGILDQQGLLDEVKLWKVSTADKSLQPEEDVAGDAWPEHNDAVSSGDAQVLQLQPRPGSSDDAGARCREAASSPSGSSGCGVTNIDRQQQQQQQQQQPQSAGSVHMLRKVLQDVESLERQRRTVAASRPGTAAGPISWQEGRRDAADRSLAGSRATSSHSGSSSGRGNTPLVDPTATLRSSTAYEIDLELSPSTSAGSTRPSSALSAKSRQASLSSRRSPSRSTSLAGSPRNMPQPSYGSSPTQHLANGEDGNTGSFLPPLSLSRRPSSAAAAQRTTIASRDSGHGKPPRAVPAAAASILCVAGESEVRILNPRPASRQSHDCDAD